MYYLVNTRTNHIQDRFDRELDAWAHVCIHTDCHVISDREYGESALDRNPENCNNVIDLRDYVNSLIGA